MVLAVTYIWVNYKSCYAHPSSIASRFESEMPIGSSFDQVKLWLEKEKGLKIEVREKGARIRRGAEFETIGASHIDARVGQCIVGFKKTTVGSWAFDEDGRLIKVHVAGYVDAL